MKHWRRPHGSSASCAPGWTGDFNQSIGQAQAALAGLEAKRSSIDHLQLSAADSFVFYSDAIVLLMAVPSEMAKIANRGQIGSAITAYVNLLQGKERAGQERAIGAAGISAGKFDLPSYGHAMGLRAAQEAYFGNYTAAADATQRDFFRETLSGPATDTFQAMRAILAKGGLSGDLPGVDANSWFAAASARIDLLKKVEDRTGADLVATASDIGGQATQSLWLLGTLITAALLACSIIVFILANSISRPLKKLTLAMGRLAAGDLDAEVPGRNRRDEVGEIGRAVEAFKVKALEKARCEAEEKQAQEQAAAAARRADMLRLADSFQATVGTIVDGVSSASTELEAAANTFSKAAETAQQLSTSVAAASEETSANVNSVASASEELSSSVSEIARQVQQSSRIAGDAVQQAQKTDALIGDLSKASERIGEVIQLITDIAAQTNLLALNATIEAARSGEAGKGFAVVASEVKALAMQTAKATDEIGQQIGNIQTATRDSVASIKEIGATIDNIAAIATAIAAAVEEQGSATREISRNIQQAAEGTTQVAEHMTDVSRGAAETGSASAQVLSSARSLSDESAHLKVEVDKFLDSVRAA